METLRKNVVFKDIFFIAIIAMFLLHNMTFIRLFMMFLLHNTHLCYDVTNYY